MTDVPRRQASRPLVDVIGPMTDDMAVNILAVLGRYPHALEGVQVKAPDAA